MKEARGKKPLGVEPYGEVPSRAQENGLALGL